MVFDGMGTSSRFVKTALVAGVPFGLIIGLFYGLVVAPFFGFGYVSWTSVLEPGAVSGVLFGAFAGAFASYQGRKFALENPCAPGEDRIKHGVANHLLRLEGVGGYLYFTTERLLFRSHKFNVQNHELSIPLEDVSSVRPSLTAGFIPNGLEVVWDDRRERFVVEDRHGWAEAIRRAKEQTRPRTA